MMSGKTIAQRVSIIAASLFMALPLAQTAEATPNYGYAALQEAKTKLGDPYVHSAAGPNSFDCSGLSQYSYEHSTAKHYLPRIANDQYKYANEISWSQRRPGDLVFFHDGSGYVFHVGIYAGVRYHWGSYRSYMIHAPKSGSNVKYEDVYENWGYAYVTFGRI